MRGLVIGGIQSGKSAFAEECAKESQKNVVYLATAIIKHEEMHYRVAKHRMRRPKNWKTIEEPVQIASALNEHSSKKCFVIVDCLTQWIKNSLFDEEGHITESRFSEEMQSLLNILPSLRCDLIMVSNEVGQCMLPPDLASRRMIEAMGTLHLNLAKTCHRVILITAGLPQVLK